MPTHPTSLQRANHKKLFRADAGISIIRRMAAFNRSPTMDSAKERGIVCTLEDWKSPPLSKEPRVNWCGNHSQPQSGKDLWTSEVCWALQLPLKLVLQAQQFAAWRQIELSSQKHQSPQLGKTLLTQSYILMVQKENRSNGKSAQAATSP